MYTNIETDHAFCVFEWLFQSSNLGSPLWDWATLCNSYWFYLKWDWNYKINYVYRIWEYAILYIIKNFYPSYYTCDDAIWILQLCIYFIHESLMIHDSILFSITSISTHSVTGDTHGWKTTQWVQHSTCKELIKSSLMHMQRLKRMRASPMHANARLSGLNSQQASCVQVCPTLGTSKYC